MKLAFGKLSFLLGLMLGGSAAIAGQVPMTVEMDQSQLITLPTDPGRIVIGNPSIADMSLNGKQLFIHGHSFGETNMMVFDNDGNKLLDLIVTVAHRTDNQLTMFVGSPDDVQRYTYTCGPNCEVNMMTGDNFTWTKDVVKMNSLKHDFATGHSTLDVKPPAPPAQ